MWDVGSSLRERGGEMSNKDDVAEWSKAVDSGSIPKGRGFKSHLQHFFIRIIKTKKTRYFINKRTKFIIIIFKIYFIWSIIHLRN